MKKYSKIIKIFLYNVVILVVLLFLMEFSFRLYKPNYQLFERSSPGEHENLSEMYASNSKGWCRRDDDLGWVFKADSTFLFGSPGYNDLPIHYTINRQGFRNKFDFEIYDSLGKNQKIMFLGDSFLASIYLDDEQTIVQQVISSLADTVMGVNLGVPGYGLDQSILSYFKFQKVVKPNIVVLFYIDDDIYRTLQAFRRGENMNKPCFTISNQKLKARTGKENSFLKPLAESSFILNRLYRRVNNAEAIQICEHLLDSLINQTKQNKQELFVFRCPTSVDVLNGRFEDFCSFKDYFKTSEAHYIELLDHVLPLDTTIKNHLFLPGDGHPSAIGAAFFGEEIANVIKTFHLDK